MTETVYVRGSGGAIFRMDVPTNVHARERWDQALDKGDLVVLPDDEIVERVVDGATFFDHVSAGARADALTRDELLAEAKARGAKVDARWSAKKIAAALAEHEATPVDDPRPRLEERARELFANDQLEAIDVMSDEDLAAAITAAETAQG